MLAKLVIFMMQVTSWMEVHMSSRRSLELHGFGTVCVWLVVLMEGSATSTVIQVYHQF